jgi:FixJ family two-component response regulator
MGVEGKVFLVDDDASVRKALTRLLRATGHVVESYPSATAFLSQARIEGPACVVVDLRLPGLSGLELQQELQRRGQDLPLVFISGDADVPSSVRAMKDGALDFLEKPLRKEDLLASVARALARAARLRADRAIDDDLQRRMACLTPREREVFALIVTGLANKQVGAELGATEKTIKVHRARVMEKMEARSLAELVRIADRLGLRPHTG